VLEPGKDSRRLLPEEQVEARQWQRAVHSSPRAVAPVESLLLPLDESRSLLR
jgi:hypothetical protein